MVKPCLIPDWGVEKEVFLENATPEGVEQAVSELVKHGETQRRSSESVPNDIPIINFDDKFVPKIRGTFHY